MKRVLYLLVLITIMPCGIFAQEEEAFTPNGKAFGKVFWNYHYDASSGAEQKNTFEIQRTYLGYKYQFSEKFSAKITLDGAKKSDASEYTVFLKIAQLDWKVADPVKLSFGLIGLKQFDTPEKFWGYRYLFKDFQDEYAFGSSADLGINAEIKIIEPLKANIFILNGEGYTKLQDPAGNIKIGGNLIYQPIKGLTFKAYYDIYGGGVVLNSGTDSSYVYRDTASIQTYSFFAGYNAKNWRVSASYTMQKDGKKYNQIAAGQDLSGWQISGAYAPSKQFELFGTVIGVKPNTLEGETESWDPEKDGQVVIGGVQYNPVKGVKMALNYRTFLFTSDNLDNRSLVYMNFEFAF